MARIKIEDLPVLEDLSTKEVKGISGGGPQSTEILETELGWHRVSDEALSVDTGEAFFKSVKGLAYEEEVVDYPQGGENLARHDREG